MCVVWEEYEGVVMVGVEEMEEIVVCLLWILVEDWEV